jgi:hypothetical protein
MPHDPILLKQEVVPKTRHGAHDMVVLHKYVAPAAGDGGIAPDPYKEKDAKIAETMMAWLSKHYPGYPWAAESDFQQGIVKFNIPVLMGIYHWYVVNLRTHDIIDAMRQGAGEILERYRQSREGFNLSAFLEARQRHSKLVIPSRLVPE